MSTPRKVHLTALALIVWFVSMSPPGRAADIGTAFSYQGFLETGAPPAPVDDTCDFRFGLWDAAAGGNQQGVSPQTKIGVGVTAGVFTVPDLDFGAGAIDGAARWLEIEVKCPPDVGFTMLLPRVELTPAPYALRASEGVGPPNALEVDTATGKVGIGTSTPAQPLDVIGNIHASGTIASGSSITIDGVSVPQTVTSSDALEFHVGVAGRTMRLVQGDDTGADPMRAPNIIGGLDINTVGAGVSAATISGGGSAGYPNTVTGSWGAIGGGDGNTAGPGGDATVGGGFKNTAISDLATVGGGYSNTASAIASTVGGGGLNVAGKACVGGTNDRKACQSDTDCPSGSCSTATPTYSTVGGGYINTASGAVATVGGGYINTASGAVATVGGGQSNTASGDASTVGGGVFNTASGDESTIGGGSSNLATDDYSTVGGGGSNTASGQKSTVSGGSSNTASGERSTIAGGSGNKSIGKYAAVGGGGWTTVGDLTTANQAVDNYATVAGGNNNRAGIDDADTTNQVYATVGGGHRNTASEEDATVGGGNGNTASGNDSTVGGGYSNTASGDASTLGGGVYNTASGIDSTVGGGYGNTASGADSTVPGGDSNLAGGDSSLAAGRRAKVRNNDPVSPYYSGDATGDEGAFVWADSTAADFTSSGPNQFLIRASGGVGMGTPSATAPRAQLDVVISGKTVAVFDRTFNDGPIISLRQEGTEEGTISVSATTVSYNAFTGSHYAWTDEAIARGTLVTLTGVNRSSHDNPESERIYGIVPTTKANDSQCLGAYLGLLEPSKAAAMENPHQVMAVGNGDMWVVDSGRNIEPGQYLISSDLKGHAMLDDAERFPVGYVVARAGEPVEWANVSDALDGHKHKRISVFFESFERGSAVQQGKIEALESRVAALERALSANAQPVHPVSLASIGGFALPVLTLLGFVGLVVRGRSQNGGGR